jgi:hypothetical protein
MSWPFFFLGLQKNPHVSNEFTAHIALASKRSFALVFARERLKALIDKALMV